VLSCVNRLLCCGVVCRSWLSNNSNGNPSVRGVRQMEIETKEFQSTHRSVKNASIFHTCIYFPWICSKMWHLKVISYLLAVVQQRVWFTRYLAHALWHREKSWRDVSRRVALVGQHSPTCSSRRTRQTRFARHVFRASSQRGLGWTCPPHFFSEVVAEIDSNTEHKTAKLVHVSITASSSSTMLEPARLDTLDTPYVSCRDVTSQVEFGL